MVISNYLSLSKPNLSTLKDLRIRLYLIMDRKLLLKKVSKKSGIKLPPIKEQNDYHIKTILDIDPEFYSLVDGRPIRPGTSIRKYKQNIKEVALKRILHGFVLDEILRINITVKSEKKKFETASKHFSECHESFNKFLADDNNKTIIIMKESDNLDKKLTSHLEDNKKACYELASLKSKLQYIEETLQILLSFQNFLYNAAPMLWQETCKFKLIMGPFEIFVVNSDIFCEIKVHEIKEKLKELPPPQLYFQSPIQIIERFQTLENQNLNYLLKTEELHCEKNKFIKSVRLLKNLLRLELDYIQGKIQEVEENINNNTIKEKELKQEFFRMLKDKIKFLVSSELVLKISTYVEFAYEQLISPNETKLSLLDQVHALEMEYETIMLDLSAFDINIIKSIEKKIYEDGTKEIKQAKEAAKLLRDMDKLSKRLNLSYGVTKN